jgi:hypothetical protein
MISINGSVRTCKVETGYADKIQSARFQQTDLMVCPNWQGTDLTGRFVSPDSFVTKTAGCNLPMDRVAVENFLRPDYMTYINLDASGFKADLYGGSCPDAATNMECYEAYLRDYQIEQTRKITGHFGGVANGGDLTIRRESFPYEKAMQQEATSEGFEYNQQQIPPYQNAMQKQIMSENNLAVSNHNGRVENFNNQTFRGQSMNGYAGMNA